MTYIHKKTAGTGRVLVMLHGWGMQSAIWGEFSEQLSKRYQLIMLDLPGHGASGNLTSYNLDTVIASLFHAIPVEKFSLLGWSLGATLSIAMALHSPQRIQSLFLIAGNPKFVQSADWAGISEDKLDTFIDQLQLNPSMMQQRFLALQVQGLPDARQLLKTMKQLLDESSPAHQSALLGGLQILKYSDLRITLKQLSCPIHVIFGEKDQLIPVACVDAMREIQPDLRVHVIKNAGHVLFLSHPHLLSSIIMAAL